MSRGSTRRSSIRERLARGAWGMGLGLGLGSAVPLACTLQLDDSLACGDGYVDELAGEQCDPGDPESFVHACIGTERPDGLAACDPVTCEIINDLEQCARCGDGEADAVVGEECDGDDLAFNTCPSGQGVLQCTSDCRLDHSACSRCGNGVLDPSEECDPLAVNNLTMGKPECSELHPPNIHKPYTSGLPGRCMDDCRWERAGCSYCGDGNLDELPLAVDPEGNIKTLPEVCDGNDYDIEVLESTIAGSICALQDGNARQIVECSDDCLDIIPRVDLEQPCCLRSGSICPHPDSALRCCFEVENPQLAEPCSPQRHPDGTYAYACR